MSRPRGTGFGTVLADFDQDGALDLAVVNGRVTAPEGGGLVPGTILEHLRGTQPVVSQRRPGTFRDISRQTNRCAAG